jgi:competence protein ComEA
MNRLKAILRSLFAFSRGETNGFLILLPLMALIIFSEPAYRYWFVRQPHDFSRDSLRLDSLMATWQWATGNDSTENNSGIERSLFFFDPNTALENDFIRLGFSASVANRIIRYRASGGKFKVKADLLKIYGMDSLAYAGLKAYINLPEDKLSDIVSDKSFPIKRETAIAKSDLNKADTAQLDKVYGIGRKLSARIIKYRNRLGGFVSLGQLNEVYGLDSAVIQRISERFIIENQFMPVQININDTAEKGLASHPYLSFKLAKSITAYRFQHGRFTSVDDLAKMQLLSEGDLKRIKPYLTVE